MTVFYAIWQKIKQFSQKITFYLLILSDKSLFLLDYARIQQTVMLSVNFLTMHAKDAEF